MIKSTKPLASTSAAFSKATKVWTNTFNLDLNLNQKVHLISLVVRPALPKDQAFVFAKLVEASKKRLVALFEEHYYLTGQVIYSLKSLPSSECELGSVDGFTLHAQTTNEEFTIKELFSDPAKAPEIVRFLNVILKGSMEARGFKEYGKHASYFSTETKPFLLDRGISVLPGFKITIDKYLDGGIKMNIDTAFRISSTQSIWREYLEEVDQARDKDAAKARFTGENIIGKSFSIQNDLNRMIKIHGVDPAKTLSGPSPVEGYPTMRAYLEDRFKCTLKEPKQLLLYTESKRRVPMPGEPHRQAVKIEKTYYPSEIMYALGLKDSHKKDFMLMKQLAGYTKMTPDQKMRTILDCAKGMKAICQGGVNMRLAGQAGTEADCKVLPNPEYKIREAGVKSAKDGIIFFKGEIHSKVAELKDWAIIYESDDRFLDEFYDLMDGALKTMGVPCADPYCYKMDPRPKLQDFRNAVDDCKANGAKFILLVISKFTGTDYYKKIKEYCDLTAQILTQCCLINPKVFTKRGYFDKICYQICSKLGFPLWIVQKPKCLQDKDTMLIGADVYHSRGKESVTAVVGTTNSDYSRFCSLSSVQPRRGQEIMDQVAEMVLECIQAFRATNKKMPKKILFYRDGVGDTMMDLVRRYEITKIKESLAKAYPEDPVQLSVIVVTKRISEKFVSQQTGGALNPRSGTIVESAVVKSHLEFFMVAQNVTEGTATPTRYQVLLNECGYSPADMHATTFFQAFNYYGWSGAVKVPAVCQYAHKLAYHVGENYRQTNRFMQNQLYYL